VVASYSVTPGDVIGIYPGGAGVNGANNVTGTGAGAGGVSSYNSAYNGGTGGNAGASGSSGGGGGGGAASIVTFNSVLKIVAGGAGGGGGMANSPNSGQPGSSSISANGTSNTGGNGTSTVGDGGGGGGGGGGQYGSIGGTVYPVGGETAGNGGYRGNNSVSGAASTFTNSYSNWTGVGTIEITFSTGGVAGGTVSSSQTICTGATPAGLSLSNFVASSLQWQYSDDNSSWNNIAGATSTELTSGQIGSLNATRYFRVVADGSVFSSTATITVTGGVSSVTPAGSGTAGDPYQVANLGNLQWISEDASRWDKYYIQTADIDASETSASCYNSGQGWYAIANGSSFTGSYDGQGHTIDNLYINRSGDDFVGLFANLSSATISNLNITNTNISGGWYVGVLAAACDGSTAVSNVHTSGSVNGYCWNYEVRMGGLIGYVQNSTTIDQCTSETFVYATDFVDFGMLYVGGLLGSSEGSMSRSAATGNIQIQAGMFTTMYVGGAIGYSNSIVSTSYASGAVDVWQGFFGMADGGGFVGLNANQIDNCYSTGSVTMYDCYSGQAGGFVGEQWNSITNCYSAADNIGSGGMWGGFAASNYNTITNSYYVINSWGVGDDGSGYGHSLGEMADIGIYYNSGWDFTCELKNGSQDYWRINPSDNQGYPTLSWQGNTMNCPEWTGQSNTTFGDGGNWQGSFIPADGMDIVINSAAANDLVLPQNWTVSNLTFNSAGKKFQIGNYDLTILGTVSGNDGDNYVQSNGTGRVKTRIAVGNSFQFPLGNSAYNPVDITNNSNGDDDFGVRVGDEVYANGANGTAVASTRVQRTWYIDKAAPNSGQGVDFVFHWNNGETVGSLTMPALYHYSGSWQRQSSGTTSYTSNSLTYTSYTGGFSPFSVADGGLTLPVTWLSFTAQKQNTVALLSWSTASEFNAKDYLVQHSTDGVNWNTIGNKPAGGTSNSTLQYSFIDKSPARGVNYYRIMQRDVDDKASYSKIVSVNFDNLPASLTIFPNPVTGGQLNIRLTLASTVRIYNSSGALVVEQQLGAGDHSLGTGRLAKGLYSIVANGQTRSFVIQ
jgi:hypothetical protein